MDQELDFCVGGARRLFKTETQQKSKGEVMEDDEGTETSTCSYMEMRCVQ